MIEEQNNFKEEKILQQVQTSTTMAQKDFEVNNAKLTYSPSFDELQCAYDELCDDLFNSKEKSLACLQNISFIENQIQSLKNAYFHEEEICLKCETSSIYETCIDLESLIDEVSIQLPKSNDYACSKYIVEKEKENNECLHEKQRKVLDCNKAEILSNNSQKTKSSSKSIVCNYCGCLGHISHLCKYSRKPCMRNKLVWVPKNIKVSNSNPQGPKMK